MSTSRPSYLRTFWQAPPARDAADEAAVRYLTTRWQIVGAAHFSTWESAWRPVTSEAAFAAFRRQRRTSARWAQAQMTEAHRISAALAAEGVPHFFLKSIALQEAMPAAMRGRCGRDIDLAIPRQSLLSTYEILRSVGYQVAALAHASSVFRHLSHYEAPTMHRAFDSAAQARPVNIVTDFRLDIHLDATHFLAFGRSSSEAAEPWPEPAFWQLQRGDTGLPILSAGGQLLLAMLKMYVEGVNEHGAKIRSYFDVLHLLRHLSDDEIETVLQRISDVQCDPILFYVLRRLAPEFGFTGSGPLTRHLARAEAALARGDRSNDFGDMWQRMTETA